ncbi:carboxyl-terminal processing protease [Evansella vedderi]|uniref:Carboxyl-terminal processing protease n=1 Tax=Evansella vedderi TaxID=38282 RepID=A0ABT9ZV07_9BACI|nr:S41 family peptidase [Evansella vedderi]MDQ0254562.1 carboxyl-terminal processing protease [Evansella vedderi]
MNVNKALLPVIIAFSILIGAGGMYAGMMIVSGDSASPVVDQNGEPAQEVNGSIMETSNDHVEKFNAAYNLILERYYREVEGDKLLEGAISGMLETLEDPYSVYMDEQTAREFMESLDASFEGIGAEVSMTNGRVTIVAPFRDSPAEKAGLRPNDQILMVDGEDVEGLSLYEAVLKIRGEKGTTVTLTIHRPGVSDPIDFDVVRDEIPIETVYSDLVEENGKRIGVIELRSFSENTAQRFQEELASLEEEGIDGLIIDVRGNPGGYLNSVQAIGNLIIPGGQPIVQIEDRSGNRERHLSNLSEEKPYPIVGLINEGSASASEILAAALMEAGGHEIVGTPTFGKGTVQQSLRMGDGSEIKLTLYKWLTSGGNFINETGVEPTIEVTQPEFFYVSPINLEEPYTYDMNNENIATAQIILDGLGYDPGRVDGYFDQNTEAAIRTFQEAMDIDVTGELDSTTAEVLQAEVINSIQNRELDNQFNKALEILTR